MQYNDKTYQNNYITISNFSLITIGIWLNILT